MSIKPPPPPKPPPPRQLPDDGMWLLPLIVLALIVGLMLALTAHVGCAP